MLRPSDDGAMAGFWILLLGEELKMEENEYMKEGKNLGILMALSKILG